MMTRALVTIGHGTVESLDDLPAFLTAIRRGHAPPDDLVTEVRRRYLAIGGRSPLNDICRDLTDKLGQRLGLRASFAARMWRPHAAEVLADLAREDVTDVLVLPLAQHSAALYVDTVKAAANLRHSQGEKAVTVVGPANWGSQPELSLAYASALREVTLALPEAERSTARVLFSAHSLPLAVLRAGDPYDREVRASAEAVARAVGSSMVAYDVVFQSQGQSQGLRGGEWLGPDVLGTLDRFSREGVKHVIFAPVGFVADHVEILYDLDIEARSWAIERGISYARTASLNASEGLVAALAAVAGAVWDLRGST